MDIALERAKLCHLPRVLHNSLSQSDFLSLTEEEWPIFLSFDSPYSLYRPYVLFFQNFFCSSFNVSLVYPLRSLTPQRTFKATVQSLIQLTSQDMSLDKGLIIDPQPLKYYHSATLKATPPERKFEVFFENPLASQRVGMNESMKEERNIINEINRVLSPSKPTTRKANAVILILCQNHDLDGIVDSLSQFESRFNHKYHYPYLFLNDKLFTAHFKNTITQLLPSSSLVEFGHISPEEWSFPSWINATMIREECSRLKQIYPHVPHMGSISYRHMCRYYSGFFFNHPLILKYDFFWRIEPSVHFTCNVTYDPFLYLMDHNKSYGFTIMLPEYPETISTLWNHTLSYLLTYYDPETKSFNLTPHPTPTFPPFSSNSTSYDFEYSLLFLKDNFVDSLLGEIFLSPFTGEYNLCHFWSNFEISSLDFFRSKEYQHYFTYLDHVGGFYYERWGDALIHSLALGIFLPKERIHYFEDIGYEHAPYENCPLNPVLQQHCQCDPKNSVNWDNYCHAQYMRLFYPFTW